jgi:hypothetical protein
MIQQNEELMFSVPSPLVGEGGSAESRAGEGFCSDVRVHPSPARFAGTLSHKGRGK